MIIEVEVKIDRIEKTQTYFIQRKSWQAGDMCVSNAISPSSFSST